MHPQCRKRGQSGGSGRKTTAAATVLSPGSVLELIMGNMDGRVCGM